MEIKLISPQGFVFPCLGSMAGRWFPPNERSTMAAIYTSGNQVSMNDCT